MSFAAALFSLCCRDSVVRPRTESKGRRGNREREREERGMERVEVLSGGKFLRGLTLLISSQVFLADSEDLWSLPVFSKLNPFLASNRRSTLRGGEARRSIISR